MHTINMVFPTKSKPSRKVGERLKLTPEPVHLCNFHLPVRSALEGLKRSQAGEGRFALHLRAHSMRLHSIFRRKTHLHPETTLGNGRTVPKHWGAVDFVKGSSGPMPTLRKGFNPNIASNNLLAGFTKMSHRAALIASWRLPAVLDTCQLGLHLAAITTIARISPSHH